MRKKLYHISFLFLAIFTFYSIYQIENNLNIKNPIINEINKTKTKYKKDYINATIIGNNILSGKNGKDINLKKTYKKMKQYGKYNETLTTIKEITPEISIENNYDKYLVGGNQTDRKISFIFPVKDNKEFINILKILDSKKVPGTFFIDGTFLEKNISFIKKHKEHEFELLSYQNDYEESFFKTSLSYLSSISNNKPKYCYTEVEKDSLLNLCKKMKLHTVKPTIIIKRNLYQEIKKDLKNGTIISIENNFYTEKDLSITIDYIKEKGYKLVSLNELLSEENNE